jgi:aspartate racemase
MRRAVLGVIGGIGPHATASFFSSILTLTPARTLTDHLHLVIDSNPAYPDINSSVLGAGDSAAPALCATAQKLESAGATVLAMVCNAAHAYADDIRRAVSIPFIDMIEAVADSAAAILNAGSGVGILATDGCLTSGIYQRALSARGLRPLTLRNAETQRLTSTVRAVGARGATDEARADLVQLSELLISTGSEVLIGGCTEIALALRRGDVRVPILDPVQILARRCLATTLHINS